MPVLTPDNPLYAVPDTPGMCEGCGYAESFCDCADELFLEIRRDLDTAC